MRSVSEIEVDLTPEAVFEVLTDARHYPRWLGGARRVLVDDPAWPAPGSTFHHEVGVGPVGVNDATSVAGIEPGRRLDLVVRARPFLVADVRLEVEPSSRGARIRMIEQPRGRFRLLSPLITPMVKLRNDHSLRQLAELLATGSR